MSPAVEKRIVIAVPAGTAYRQWTRFEEFPHFMSGVESVRQLDESRLEWVAHIAGVRRKWNATILEQIPDRKVAWASTDGPTNAGVVEFEEAGSGKTLLKLTLEYQPEGLVERVGDLLHIVARQAEADLKRFKDFIEHGAPAEGSEPSSGPAPGSGAGAGPGVKPAGVEPAAAPPEYNRFAHPFDQTGGLVDFEGESDETAEGERHSAAERRRERERHGLIWRADGTSTPD